QAHFAIYLNGSDEPLLGGTERDHYAIGRGFGLYGDIGILACAVELFDRLAHFGQVERRSGLERKHAGEIRGSDRLRPRVESNLRNRLAFICCGWREIVSMRARQGAKPRT